MTTRRSWLYGLTMYALGAACSGVVPAHGDQGDALPRSGSRLVLLRLRGADGSAAVRSDRFFDTALGVECAPVRASDGQVRCLPETPVDAAPLAGALLTDPDCIRPVAAVDVSCDAPRFIIGPAEDTCGGVRVYEAGLPIPATDVYLPVSGACVPYPPFSYLRFYRIAREIPPSEFVAMSSEH